MLQVIISPLGRSTKLETEADDHGGDLRVVMSSKSTARGARRMKPERVMELHLLRSLPTGCNLSHSPRSLYLSSSLICPFSLFQTSFPPHAHPSASLLLTLLISFQRMHFRFHLTPLPHLYLHQTNFLTSSSTDAFSYHPCLPRFFPHSLFSPSAVAIPRDVEKEVSFVTT